ncbi:MAG: PhnD/SsuA/transferrin family substrate-binding protein, partial [Clostridiales bacterium]|nr:PhnD/SsuA/transferrin family substrate-binding protein [Clostridiales bacterium]
MKKNITAVLCIILIFALRAGCGTKSTEPSAKVSESPAETTQSPAAQTKVTVAGLAGPSSIGMIKLISEKALDGDSYSVDYQVAAAPDELTAKLINGEVQIAALPTNSAAVLYNKTEGQVQFLALDTLGVLYLVGKDSAGVTSLKDLAGKTISISGSGSVPEYAVEYILDKA